MVKRHNRKLKNRIMATVLAAVVLGIAVFAAIGPVDVFALFDESKAIKYSEYIGKGNTIDEASLFIGTYIIHKDSLEEYYDKAVESQSESAQNSVYYKSELAGGSWYDITEADGGIQSIVSGTPVTDAELADLYITFVVGKDGAVIDAAAGGEVNPFNTPDPYDIKSLPEFSSAKEYYEGNFKKKSETGDHSEEYYYDYITRFFELNLRNDVTDKCDRQIDALYPAYRALKASGQDEVAAILYRLIGQIDAKRRAEIYAQLCEEGEELETFTTNVNKSKKSREPSSYTEMLIEILQSPKVYKFWSDENDHFSVSEVIKYIQGYSTESGDDDSDEESDEESEEDSDEGSGSKSFDMSNLADELEGTKYENGTQLDYSDFKVNQDMIDILYNALSDCTNSYNDYLSGGLSETDSVIGSAEYKRAQAIVDAAEGGLTGDMIEQLYDLQRIYNIRDNVVGEADKELEIIEGELLPAASDKYEDKVLEGVSNEYAKLVNETKGSAKAADDLLESQMGDAEGARSELQFFITGKKMRTASATALSFVYERIDIVRSLYDQIPADAYKTKAYASANNHEVWLNELAEEIISENSDLASEKDKLKEQKEELLEEKNQALDDGNINLANKIDAKLAAIDEAIADANTTAGSGSDTGSGSGSGSGSDTGSGSGNSSGSNTGSGDNDGDASGDGSGSGSGVSGTAVNKESEEDSVAAAIADKAKEKMLNGQDASDQLAALADMGADDALEDLKDDLKDAGVDTKAVKDAIAKAQGKAVRKGTGLTESEIQNILEDVLGGEFKDLDDKNKIIALAAVNWFGQLGATEASHLAVNWISACEREDNPFVFATLVDPVEGEFASVEAISRASQAISGKNAYRYIFNSTRRKATLSGKQYYYFTAGSSMVEVGGDKPDSMLYKARFAAGTNYIPELACKNYFELVVEPIDGTSLSVLEDGAMRKTSIELLEAFKKAL